MQDASNTDTRIVSVALGARGYDIVIGGGLLARSGELIAQRLGVAKCAIVWVMSSFMASFTVGAMPSIFFSMERSRSATNEVGGTLSYFFSFICEPKKKLK